jgi:acylphosphatase
MQRECRRVYYSGRVQGVGFRFTAQRLARGFDVAGYVRNLPDGRVELVAEGDSAQIDGLLEAVRDELGPYIRDVTAESSLPPPGPCAGFTIRY